MHVSFLLLYLAPVFSQSCVPYPHLRTSFRAGWTGSTMIPCPATPPSQPQLHPPLSWDSQETRAWETCTPSIFPRKGDKVRGHSRLGQYRVQISAPPLRSYCNLGSLEADPEKFGVSDVYCGSTAVKGRGRTQDWAEGEVTLQGRNIKPRPWASSSGFPLSLRTGCGSPGRGMSPGEAASMSEADAEGATAEGWVCLHSLRLGARPPW